MTRPQHKLWGWEAFLDSHKSFIAKYTDRHLGNCTERCANYAAERMTNGNVRAVCGADCFSNQKNKQCHAIQMYIGAEQMEMPVLQHALTHRYVQCMGLRTTPIYIVELNDTVCSFGLRNNLHHRLHACFHSFCSIISISFSAVSQMSMAINDFRCPKKASVPSP